MSAIELGEVRRQVAEGVLRWDDEDVTVRVEQAARDPLNVTVRPRETSSWQGVW